MLPLGSEPPYTPCRPPHPSPSPRQLLRFLQAPPQGSGLGLNLKTHVLPTRSPYHSFRLQRRKPRLGEGGQMGPDHFQLIQFCGLEVEPLNPRDPSGPSSWTLRATGPADIACLSSPGGRRPGGGSRVRQERFTAWLAMWPAGGFQLTRLVLYPPHPTKKPQYQSRKLFPPSGIS